MNRLLLPAAFAAALCYLSGCGPAKLNVEKELDFSGDANAKAVDLSAQPKPQKVSVKYSSSDGDVTVLVFKKADAKDDESLETAESGKALAKERGKEGTLTVDVPENTETRVVVRQPAKKPKVKLHITN